MNTQAELQTQLLRGLEALDARLRLADLSATPAGGWSAAQILEHVAMLNTAYLARLRPLAGRGEPVADGAWRPTLLGGYLTTALTKPAKLSAPAAARPGPAARPGLLDAVLATHAELRQLIRQAEDLNWRRLKLTSPYAWFLRPNFGDACLLILRHGERHAAQIERLTSSRVSTSG
jgi:hypothetical protein